MLCVAFNKQNPEEYVAKRKGYYTYFSRALSYSFVGTREQVEKRMSSVKKKCPEIDVEVRDLTPEEVQKYEKYMAQEESYRNLCSSNSSVYVHLRDNDKNIQIAFKKKLNKTDRALKQLFQKLGLTVYKNDNGYEYVKIVR